MTSIIIQIPDEIKELALASNLQWQIVVGKRLKEELEELKILKKVIAKSALTQKKANKLSDQVNTRLAKHYEGLLKGK